MSNPASPNPNTPAAKDAIVKLLGYLVAFVILGTLLFGFFGLSMFLLSLGGSEELTFEVVGPFDRPIKQDRLKDGPEDDPQKLDWKLARGEALALEFKTGIYFKSSFNHKFNRVSRETTKVNLEAPSGLLAEPAVWDSPSDSPTSPTRGFQKSLISAAKDAPLGRHTFRLKVQRPGAARIFERTFSIEIVDAAR